MRTIPLPAILAACAAVALGLAALPLLPLVPWADREPESPEPVGSLEKKRQEPSFLSRFEVPLPSKPMPTPRSERDEAIEELARRGLQPTESAAAEQLTIKQPTTPIALFLKAGVSPDASNREGRPLLVLACVTGRKSEAETLLNAGANPNAVDAMGLTALMAAARSGDRALLDALLERGASLADADPEGHTALHHAILAGQTTTASRLIEAGAVVTPCCDGSGTLTLHALESRNREALETALTLEKPAEWHPDLAAALLDAVQKGDRAMVQMLLAHHEAAPPQPGSRHPLLGFAVARGDHDMLRLLLECGADPNTLLGSPVDTAFAELVSGKTLRYYLEKEAGMTALMLAAGRGDPEAVAVLLEHGAKRNALTRKSRWPALSFAAQVGSIEAMQLLLGKTPAPDDQQMRIEISLSDQTARVWRNNDLAFATRVSTGRSGYRTPSGRFVITDKIRNRISSLYHVNMPYFMRLNCSAIGMHAGHVPGYPASHGCIRVPPGNAARLFREVPVGTLVIIR